MLKRANKEGKKSPSAWHCRQHSQYQGAMSTPQTTWCQLHLSINYSVFHASISLLCRTEQKIVIFSGGEAKIDPIDPIDPTISWKLWFNLAFLQHWWKKKERTHPSVKLCIVKINLPRQNVLNWSFGSLSRDLLFTVQLCRRITLTCNLCFPNQDLKWVQRLCRNNRGMSSHHVLANK